MRASLNSVAEKGRARVFGISHHHRRCNIETARSEHTNKDNNYMRYHCGTIRHCVADNDIVQLLPIGSHINRFSFQLWCWWIVDIWRIENQIVFQSVVICAIP